MKSYEPPTLEVMSFESDPEPEMFEEETSRDIG